MSEAAAQDALDELRERLRATALAAERLVDEAAAERASADVPGAADDANQELRALVSLVELLRDLLPSELREELAKVVRQLLLLVRAVIDWWIARIETTGDEEPAPEPVPVEDIPLS